MSYIKKLTVKPGTPGAARVEYYACREDMGAMLAWGYPFPARLS